MTPAERALLLALFRWAYADGIVNVGWRGGFLWRPRVGREILIGYAPRMTPDAIDVATDVDSLPAPYRVGSVAQAVDILAALGVIPPTFSSAYQAGWEAGRGDMEHPVPAGSAFRAILPVGLLP